jgi:hypothetical protein
VKGPKLSRCQWWSLTLVGGAAWGTGAVLLWARYFGRSEGAFGVENHWLESPARAIHGFVILLVLLALGSLAPNHFVSGWRTGARRSSALVLAGGAVIMILTGWGLYYVAHDTVRQGMSWTHSALGLLMLPFFFLHSRQRKG